MPQSSSIYKNGKFSRTQDCEEKAEKVAKCSVGKCIHVIWTQREKKCCDKMHGLFCGGHTATLHPSFSPSSAHLYLSSRRYGGSKKALLFPSMQQLFDFFSRSWIWPIFYSSSFIVSFFHLRIFLPEDCFVSLLAN